METISLPRSKAITYDIPSPNKEGYSFDNWYLDSDFQIVFNVDKLVPGENHLYAKYVINQYQVTIHGLKTQTLTFNYDEDLSFDINWGDNYYFGGYYTDEGYSEEFTLTKMPAHSVDLYPRLIDKNNIFTLEFNSNTEEQFESFTGNYGELQDYLPPTPQKAGYEFDDWYLDQSYRTKYNVKRLHEGNNNLYAKFDITDLTLQGQEIVYSTNMLDMDNFKTGKALTPDGRLVDFPGGYTDYIPVKYGDYVIFGDGVLGVRYIRFVTAYNAKHRVLPNKGSYDGTHLYKVPHGVAYVRLSLYSSNLYDDSRINISRTILRHEPYYQEIGPIGETIRRRQEYDEKYRPFSTVRANELESASYKPLGILKKPYFCLVSDDGLKEEATYSIPMAISKGVPMTLGLMIGSEIWQEPYLSTLKDAVANHGFEVAQHGWMRYTEYTEDQLNYFFDLEEAYFESMGFKPKTAICPAHAINKLVSAVASQRYEALRTGYLNSGNYEYGYGWYTNGPTSNVYALDCINISSEPLVDHKAHIDDACRNNWLIIGFYHENELNDEKKEKIEAIIDYAKEKGMEFCTLSEVPHLSER